MDKKKMCNLKEFKISTVFTFKNSIYIKTVAVFIVQSFFGHLWL